MFNKYGVELKNETFILRFLDIRFVFFRIIFLE